MSIKTKKTSSSKQTSSRRAAGTSARKSSSKKMEASRKPSSQKRARPSTPRKKTGSRSEAGRLAEARWDFQDAPSSRARSRSNSEKSQRSKSQAPSRLLDAQRHASYGRQGIPSRQTRSLSCPDGTCQSKERNRSPRQSKAHESPARRGFEIRWDDEFEENERYGNGDRSNYLRGNREELNRSTTPRWSFMDEEDYEEDEVDEEDDDQFYPSQRRLNPRESTSNWGSHAGDYQEGNSRAQRYQPSRKKTNSRENSTARNFDRSLYDYNRPTTKSRRNNKNSRA